MSPWEMREHLDLLFGEAVPSSAAAAGAPVPLRFARTLACAVVPFGDRAEGWPRYSATLGLLTR